MDYAQIKDGAIKNVIVLNDAGLVSLFEVGFDYCLRIDDLDPVPKMGWEYDSGTDTYIEPAPVAKEKANYYGSHEVESDESMPVTIDLPPNTTNGVLGQYVVGSNTIDVFLNGQKMNLNNDYSEVGAPSSHSTQIVMHYDLKSGDLVEIRGR